MGSFIGHVDEAVFFLGFGVWWMCITFPRYIISECGGPAYTNRLSYGLPCKRRIPIEAILKTLFPVAGFIGELANGRGPHFVDKDGNFQKLNGLQHMTIYGMFVLHGLLDILTFCKVRGIPPKAEYLSGCLSFLWYGISFQFHASMPGKPPMEKMVHILPTYVIFLTAAVIACMVIKPHTFVLDIVRVWCLLVLGTWFIHTSFIMYQPWGGSPNPEWDRNDHRNVHFLVAAFGAHCCLHIVTISIFYFLSSLIILQGCGGGGSSDRKPHIKEDNSVGGGVYYKRVGCTGEECEILIDQTDS